MSKKRDDPLIGKIFSADQKEWPYQDLIKKMLNADIIYLGENHDNADHHQNQLRIIKDLVNKGKKPRLGFEFFSVDQTGYLMSFVSNKNVRHSMKPNQQKEDQLRTNLGWQQKSDMDWKFYFQFLDLASKNGLTVFGADLPKGIINRVTSNNIDQLTAVEKDFLKPSGFKDNRYRDLMFNKFKNAHCGYANQKMMEKMYRAWLARNDAMAHSIVEMIKENSREPVVMILGKGHVEHNMAIFERVQTSIPTIKQFNLGFIEIHVEPSKLTEYFSIEKPFLPAHEFVWFTQRASYEDPCKQFHKALSRMKKQ